VHAADTISAAACKSVPSIRIAKVPPPTKRQGGRYPSSSASALPQLRDDRRRLPSRCRLPAATDQYRQGTGTRALVFCRLPACVGILHHSTTLSGYLADLRSAMPPVLRGLPVHISRPLQNPPPPSRRVVSVPRPCAAMPHAYSQLIRIYHSKDVRYFQITRCCESN